MSSPHHNQTNLDFSILLFLLRLSSPFIIWLLLFNRIISRIVSLIHMCRPLWSSFNAPDFFLPQGPGTGFSLCLGYHGTCLLWADTSSVNSAMQCGQLFKTNFYSLDLRVKVQFFHITSLNISLFKMQQSCQDCQELAITVW